MRRRERERDIGHLGRGVGRMVQNFAHHHAPLDVHLDQRLERPEKEARRTCAQLLDEKVVHGMALGLLDKVVREDLRKERVLRCFVGNRDDAWLQELYGARRVVGDCCAEQGAARAGYGKGFTLR